MPLAELDKQSLFVLHSSNFSEVSAVTQLVLLIATECAVVLTFYVVFFRWYCYASSNGGGGGLSQQPTLFYSHIVILCCLLNAVVVLVSFTPLATSIAFGFWALDENFCQFTSAVALTLAAVVVTLSTLSGVRVGVCELVFKKPTKNSHTLYQLMLLNIIFGLVLAGIYNNENISFYKPLAELWPHQLKLCLMFNHPDVYYYRVMYSFYLGFFSAIALKSGP